MTYEELQISYSGLTIIETDLSNVNGLKGLIVDDCIAIDKNLSYIEKACVLAEELGHYLTSTGNILDQRKITNRKQEKKARSVAYDMQIGLFGIVEAYESGCTSSYMIADYLEITEPFLHEAINHYRNKFGIYAILGDYIIYFEPSLGVMRMLNEKTPLFKKEGNYYEKENRKNA